MATVTVNNAYRTTVALRSRWTHYQGRLTHWDYREIPAGTDVVRVGSRPNAVTGTEIFVAVPSRDGIGEYASGDIFYRTSLDSLELR